MDIETKRNEIDQIDDEIVRLLVRRAEIARQISVTKLNAGLPILDRTRESRVFARVRHMTAGKVDSDTIDRIYRAILSESRRVQAAAQKEMRDAGAVR